MKRCSRRFSRSGTSREPRVPLRVSALRLLTDWMASSFLLLRLLRSLHQLSRSPREQGSAEHRSHATAPTSSMGVIRFRATRTTQPRGLDGGERRGIQDNVLISAHHPFQLA